MSTLTVGAAPGNLSTVAPATRLRRIDRTTLIFGSLNLVLVLLAVLGPVLIGGDPQHQNLIERLQRPSWLGGHGGALGTDDLGRSVLLQILAGMRTSYLIGAGGVAIAAVVGTTAGMFAGYRGGWVDSIIMRLVDVQSSLPVLLIVLVLVTAVGGSRTSLILILGFSGWLLYARVARSAAIALKATELVDAHKTVGCSDLRIIIRHLIPNSATSLLAVTSLQFATLMLAESALSYIGLGVQPPVISLGGVLAEGSQYLQVQWWMSTFAGLTLAIMIAAANLLGSHLQQSWSETGNSDWSLR